MVAAPAGQVRKARLADVPAMKAVIDVHASQNKMLFRAQAELYETIRDYFVYEENGAVLGCCGLHVVWEDLAEVRGLAVAVEAAGRGIGSMLVRACLDEACELGVRSVYTLTLVPSFFERLGFTQVDKSTLHLKMWYECYRCSKFANCDEIAMVCRLNR